MKTTLSITGMTCEHCVKHVTSALEQIPGVSSVEVRLKENSARVEHAESVSLAGLKAAVEEAGYGAA
jgi:copper ion binding protein